MERFFHLGIMVKDNVEQEIQAMCRYQQKYWIKKKLNRLFWESIILFIWKVRKMINKIINILKTIEYIKKNNNFLEDGKLYGCGKK